VERLLEGFNPKSLKRTLDKLALLLTKRIGIPVKYESKEKLRSSRGIPTYGFYYTIGKIWIRFNFVSAYGEKVASVDIMNLRGKNYTIDTSQVLIASKIQEIADLIKKNIIPDDPEFNVQIKKNSAIQKEVEILSPAEKEAQETFNQYITSEQNLRDTVDAVTSELNSLLRGSIRGIIVSGTPGIGKTFNITQFLEERAPGSYVIIDGGKMTVPTFYATLHDNANNIIVFDDIADSVMHSTDCANMIKGALQTKPPRRVNYGTSTQIKIQDQIYPPVIPNFNGKLIIITNEQPNKLFSGPAGAVLDRVSSINFDITLDELVSYVESIIDNIEPETESAGHLTLEEKMQIFDYYKKFTLGKVFVQYKMKGYVSIRTFVRMMNYYIELGAFSDEWKRKCINRA
jgi:hypothetical protein